MYNFQTMYINMKTEKKFLKQNTSNGFFPSLQPQESLFINLQSTRSQILKGHLRFVIFAQLSYEQGHCCECMKVTDIPAHGLNLTVNQRPEKLERFE